MITDIIIRIFDWLLRLIIWKLPVWTPYPAEFKNGLNYFISSFKELNFIIPVDTILSAGLIFIGFEVIYYGAKLIIMIINFFRGSGEIKI